MRVLITGATGFLGSHLFERLAGRGVETLGVARDLERASPDSLRRGNRISQLATASRHARLVRCASGAELDASISHFKPTACVHLAGRSSVRESLQNPGIYAESNLRDCIALLESLRHAGCRRVIHASTVMVYGKDAPLPYREDRIGSTPASFYGASKLSAEVALNTWRALHGMEALNLRLFSVYGPELRSDCVPHLIASAILKDAEFSILGDGSSVRDYVAVSDVVNALEAALSVDWRADFPTALNIGSGAGTSLREMIRWLEEGLKKSCRILFKPAMAGELHEIVADISSAEHWLGWKPVSDVRSGIANLTQWFLRERAR